MRVGSVRSIGLALTIVAVAALAVSPLYAASGDLAAQPAGTTGIGNWQWIADSPLEFDFTHRGGDAPVQLLAKGDPPNSLAFNVYTDAQWKNLASGNTSQAPVGMGTYNSLEPSD